MTISSWELRLVFGRLGLNEGTFIQGPIFFTWAYLKFIFQIACKLLRRTLTGEGETVQEMVDLKVEPDSNTESCIFFVWPLEIIHVIDESSPLYNISAEDLTREKFEVVVIMEGTIETSSMTFQAR